MADKIKKLKLWASEEYSIEWVKSDMGKEYNPEEQVDVLLGLLFNHLPGSAFEALANRLGITEDQLLRSCK